MATNRASATKPSKSRDMLIDAADHLLTEEGAYAISARRVADRAGLKPQLVHYYFETMDDLIIALFRRSNEQHRALYLEARSQPYPLRALWKLNIDRSDTKRVMAFIALGTRRESLRAEMVRTGEEFRAVQIAFVANVLKERGIATDVVSPGAIVTLMAAISRTMVTEAVLGLTRGHAEVHRLVNRFLDHVEPLTDAVTE